MMRKEEGQVQLGIAPGKLVARASRNAELPRLSWTECLGPHPIHMVKPKPPI